jgi:methyl-accepting chemotaxis protein
MTVCVEWFGNLKISSKLMAGFVLVSVVAAVASLVGVINIRTIGSADTYLYKAVTVPAIQLGRLDADLNLIQVNLRNVLLADTQESIEKSAALVRDMTRKINEMDAVYGQELQSPDMREAFEKYLKAKERWSREIAKALKFGVDNMRFEALTLLRGDLGTANRELENAIRTMVDMQVQKAKATAESNAVLATHATRIMIVAIVVSLALAAGLGFWLSRVISTPIRKVAQRAERVREYSITNLDNALSSLARGELDMDLDGNVSLLDIDSKDEIGALAQTINGIVHQTQSTIASFIEARNTIRALLDETNSLSQAAEAGRLSARGHAEKFKGGYGELVAGLNRTLDAVVTPVNEASAVLERLAKRDLSVRMHGEYKGDHAKIKEMLNTALKSLDESMSQVASGAAEVGSAATEIDSASQTLAGSASEQAGSLEEVSASLQEFASMTGQNAANCKEARSIAEAARKSAEQGSDQMKRLSQSIERIKASADSTAKIVKTIDEIAFQTNLLALNAAVEAARAGDAGKGFAVVAEEVRNLAMRSAEAAKNTANLIEESVRNAEGGVTINSEVSAHLKKITEQVLRVSDVMSEIAAASEQQTEGIAQVNTGVEQMNQVTQQTAAGAQQSAASAQELSAQASNMLQMVETFSLTAARTKTPPPRTDKEARFRPNRIKPAAKPPRQYIDPSKLIPFADEAVLKEF